MNKLETEKVSFEDAIAFSWPKIISLAIQNLTFDGEWVEGDIVLKYDLSGEKTATQHFKTKLNVEQDFNIGPATAKFRVWLDGTKLWFGIKLCIGPICTDEFKTSVDVPH